MAKYSTAGSRSAGADSELQDRESEPRLWLGLLAFASLMLAMLGAFHVLGGVVALLEDGQHVGGEQGLTVSVSSTAFGIAHMTIGVVMMLAGYALFWGRTWGRVVAVVVAMASAITNLASTMSTDRTWFALMIVVDILVIYAVTVHGSESLEH